jgi:hypothetical protein
MTKLYSWQLASLGYQLPIERYGDYCDRIERVLHDVIDRNDNSDLGIETLAIILMTAPADFDTSSHRVISPSMHARVFLSRQTEEVKSLFRQKARMQPNFREGRIKYLLSEL